MALFQNCLKAVFDLCFPLRSIRVNPRDPPWVTTQLKVLINDRDRAFSRRQRLKYLRLRRQVRVEVQSAKGDYIKRAVNSGDVRRTWTVIKAMGKHPSVVKSTNHPSLNAKHFNDYFSSVFQSSDPPLLQNTNNSGETSFFSEQDVYKQLCCLRRKSSGIDGIPFWVYRDFRHILSSTIMYILNQCAANCLFPSCFKIAAVVPIPKVKGPTAPIDYRPISLLPSLSKVYEKLILKTMLLPYLRGKFHPSQFAFVPAPGTGAVNALTLLSHHILQFLDDTSGAVRILSIDLSKAFGKVTHDVIISAARKFSLPENVISLIV